MKPQKNQISSKITSSVCALLASLAMFAGPSAFAANATDTWVGNTSANLNDSNWTGLNNPPIAGDNWVFGATGPFGAILNNNYSGGISASNILFGAGASAFTFISNPITVTQGSITNSSTALQTFNGNVILAGASNRIVLNAGGGDITIGGILTNSASLLNLAGAGNLTLTNVNTAFTSQLIMGSGSTLTISGAGAIGAGSAGNYSWVNAVSASTNNGTIIYSSSVTNEFNPRMDGTGGIIVNGPGVFRASAANSWGISGNFVVNGGMYVDAKGTPANGRSGFGETDVPGRTFTANNGSIVSIDAGTAFDQNNNQFIYSLAFIINTNSLMRVTTGTSIICPVFLNGGALMATNGSFVLGGTITTGGGFKSSMLSSNGGFNFGSAIVSAGYQTPFVVNPTPAGSGAGGDDLYVEAAMRNGGAWTGFTLSGGGTMRLVKASTFNGPISVAQGKLILGNPLIPGDTTVLGTNGDYLGNITISSNATFVVNTTQPQIFEGILSGAGGGGSLVVSPGVTLSLGSAATTVSPLSLVISNTATLDVSQMTSGSLGSTVMGFGTINGNATTASGAVIKGGIPGTYGTLAINGNLTMGVGAVFNLELSTASAGLNGQVTVSGSLTANGTQIHLRAPSTVVSLDTQNYTLVTSAGFSGSVSPAPIWDVAPANANYYYITNINNNIVLAYSSVALPTPGGTSSPANVLRNQKALLVVTAVPSSGQTVTNLVVDASSLGGSSSLALAPNGAANTWTNSVLIAAGQAPGVYFLPATAIDTTPSTGNGIVIVNVIASTEVWAGLGGDQNFDTSVNWAVQPGQTLAYPPASSGDSLSFAGSANLNPVMDQSYSVNGLTFTNGAGTFNLTASGGNVLTLATGGGVTNLSTSLETINLPILSSSAGPATFSASNGNLTMSGGFADNNGGLAVNGPMTKTFTLTGANTFTGPLFVNRGTMALATSLTETYHIWVPQLANSTAALNVLSGGNLAVVDGTNMTVAPQPGAIGAMSVSAGGSINIPSGTLTLGSGSGSIAYFNIIGGDVGVGTGINVASLGDHARFDMSGGTCTLNNNLMHIGTGTGQPFANGEVNFSGGTYNSLNSWTTAGLGGGIFVGENGTGVLNISGNAMVNVWGETNVVIGVNTTGTSPGYTAFGKGTVNLLGGTLVTAQIAGGTGPLSVFNFNGGTVSNYAGGISFSTGGLAPYFMYNVQNTYVYSGGAIIDDGGGNIIINQALQPPSGFGLPGITVTTGGSGYFAPPYVTISGGSGTGATASAVISGGSVTAVNVTCPGTGYASGEKLTIAFGGGGGTGAAATNLTLVANRSGGLTYSSLGGAGNGTLTLLGASTYTNTTTIKSGTLQLGAGGSINNSAVIAISNNATFDGSPAGGINLNTQLLKGFGNVNGVLTAKAGSMIYPGNDPAIGTLTFNNGGLNMAAGSQATFNLNTSATVGPNDQLVINGASSSLIFANNTIHIKASNPGVNMDTGSPYILIQNNSSVNRVGLPSTTPVFDVAPLNVGSGFWLIQPSGNNIVLLNSSVAPPGGLASVTAGAINGTNVVRNTTITVSVGVSGPNIQTVTVDLSGYGGAVTPLTQVGATTNWTGSMTIPPGLPPGPFNLPIVAYDGNLYGGVPLSLNALPTAVTWNGANFNSTPNTDNNGNWAGSAAPGYVGDTAIFAGSTGLQPVFNQNYILNNIGFASGAGRFVLNSSVGSIGITGGVTNNSANVETLNIPLTLAGTVFSGASGTLVLSNTLSGSGLLNIGAGASGVTLNGTDTHTGNTTIANGGSLIMGPFGQWQDPFSNPYYSGSTTNNGNFTYNSPLDQSIVGVISGAGSITVNGSGGTGSLTLNASNSYSGNLTINGTTVYDPVPVNGGSPTVSGLGNPQSGNTNIINNGGTVVLNAPGGNEFGNGSTTPTSKFIINQGGVVRITSGNAVMGPITLNGGTLSIASVASTQYAPYELSSIAVGGTSPSAISCESGFGGNTCGINLTINAAANAQMPINVASTGSGGPDLVVSAVMVNSGGSQNAAGFVKNGTGTMEMTAVNIFTGPITVGNGTVLLDGDSQLGGGVYPGNMVISNGAAFIFASTQIQTNLGTLSGAGTLVVSNTTGSGLILSNANSMTGPIAIKAGTLTLLASALPNTSSGISIAPGATLDVSQRVSPYVWPAVSSLSASGNTASPALINSAGAVSLSSGNAVNLTYDNIEAAPQPALNITGTLSLGANAFTVNTANGQPLAAGDYVLIQATGAVTSSGNPSVTGTAIGSGTRGSIAASGQQVILTVSPVSTVPPTIAYSLSGPVLTLSWPPDHLGYILQSNSVNLAVSSNWFNIPGSSSVTNFPITVQSVKTNVFFRLILP